VNYWRAEGWHAVDVGIYEHLVIEPQDRVIEDGGVECNAQIRAAEGRAMPGQGVVNACGKAVINSFFLAPRANLR